MTVHEYVPNRLAHFRELRGLTRKEVACLIEMYTGKSISYVAVHKHEHGETVPRLEVLEAYGKIYKVLTAELFLDLEIYIDTVPCRSPYANCTKGKGSALCDEEPIRTKRIG